MIFSQNAMVFNQVEHLIKMVNDFYSNATWFATHNVFISYLLTHLFTQPTTYIPITPPPPPPPPPPTLWALLGFLLI